MKGNYRLFLAIFCISLLMACAGSKKISNQNIASLYSPDLNFTFPKFRYYNFSNDSVRLYFRIRSADFLAVSNTADGRFTINFGVLIVLHQSFESKMTLDSSYLNFVIPVETVEAEGKSISYAPVSVTGDSTYFVTRDGYIESSVDFRALNGADYTAQVFVSDIHRRTSVSTYFTIDRTGKQPIGDFLPVNTKTGRVIISNYFDQPDTLKLFSATQPGSNALFRYFGRNFPIAPPPYSDVEAVPLSYFSDFAMTIPSLEQTGFPISRHGIYHIQFDSLEKEGFTEFRFEPDFPRLTDAFSLLESIRYLTTRDEYATLLKSTNKKEAIDDFWVSLAGNHERARVLIRNYYSRVQLANEWFSSYLEGWKSDRGLIYVIFGPPAAVYRDNTSESWNYSSASSFGPLVFTFDKINNPFTDNDFRLRRNASYEGPWYRAVDGWRDGRVMDGNN